MDSSSLSHTTWKCQYHYVSTVGNIREETMKKYIQEQSDESKEEDTRK